eukprot:CAMPEP_0197004112 /NCGR_PEP_ID=MMETSP1380-20130617/18951_1 /TAXON_ID=5936 /ORGANISM="Euplotes crassus, Strain CT5" /LENGTH=318 /DNA_ID=CAMNT_0042422795 /DNA_START=13 /DNA_END=966 /DNA_ORIENTATION=+
MERISRKTLLVYQGKSEEVYINPKITDLKSRAETYFRIQPRKFMISYKGLLFIYEDPLETIKGLSSIEKKLEKHKIECNKNFIAYLKEALSEKGADPFRVKIIDLQRWWDKHEQDSDEEVKIGEEEKVDKEALAERVGFVYLFKEITKFDFDLASIRDMPDLINELNKQLKPQYEAKGKEFHEPYSLNITNSKGRLTPVKNMEQLFAIVREFPKRDKVFFSIKPYFHVGPSELTSKDKVVESKEIVSALQFREGEEGKFNSESVVLSETNFLDTLDEVTQDRIRTVKESGGGEKTDKEIYNLLNENDGDVDAVLDVIW